MRALHWFRNDLRLHDHAALARAAGADELCTVFVFDDALLRGRWLGAPRVRFLRACVERLRADLARRGHVLLVRRGDPRRLVPALARELGASLVTWARDYSPHARARDAAVAAALSREGIAVGDVKDRVCFEAEEIRTGSGGPYRVYTPFRRAWIRRFREDPQEPVGDVRLPRPVSGEVPAAGELPDEAALGAADDETELPAAGEGAARRRLARFVEGALARYATDRDRPAVDGTSRLSPYLRFGVLSPRTAVHAARLYGREHPEARDGARTWVDELVWREFYVSVLASFPQVLREPFRPEFAAIRWEDDEKAFAAWQAGRTGYPFVDAGMRQLAAEGWMHNRARMVVASFLAKDLLVDWRRGEQHFMERLVDGDPAANDGGWQWAASTGTDAQPWFRIFNPVRQGERFDPEGAYVRRWIPELADVSDRFVHHPWDAPEPPAGYPAPIVDHASRRILALERYEAARRSGGRA